MVFNSYEFILIFLPLAFGGFLLAHKIGGWRAAFNATAIASLVFYAQWSLTLLGILLVSVVSNFVVGNILGICETRRSIGAVAAHCCHCRQSGGIRVLQVHQFLY